MFCISGKDSQYPCNSLYFLGNTFLGEEFLVSVFGYSAREMEVANFSSAPKVSVLNESAYSDN